MAPVAMAPVTMAPMAMAPVAMVAVVAMAPMAMVAAPPRREGLDQLPLAEAFLRDFRDREAIHTIPQFELHGIGPSGVPLAPFGCATGLRPASLLLRAGELVDVGHHIDHVLDRGDDAINRVGDRVARKVKELAVVTFFLKLGVVGRCCRPGVDPCGGGARTAAPALASERIGGVLELTHRLLGQIVGQVVDIAADIDLERARVDVGSAVFLGFRVGLVLGDLSRLRVHFLTPDTAGLPAILP